MTGQETGEARALLEEWDAELDARQAAMDGLIAAVAGDGDTTRRLIQRVSGEHIHQGSRGPDSYLECESCSRRSR